MQWLIASGVLPLAQLERSCSLRTRSCLLLFFVLFLAVVRNPNVPYFVRFNTLQALLTDIIGRRAGLRLHDPAPTYRRKRTA